MREKNWVSVEFARDLRATKTARAFGSATCRSVCVAPLINTTRRNLSIFIDRTEQYNKPRPIHTLISYGDRKGSCDQANCKWITPSGYWRLSLVPCPASSRCPLPAARCPHHTVTNCQLRVVYASHNMHFLFCIYSHALCKWTVSAVSLSTAPVGVPVLSLVNCCVARCGPLINVNCGKLFIK